MMGQCTRRQPASVGSNVPGGSNASVGSNADSEQTQRWADYESDPDDESDGELHEDHAAAVSYCCSTCGCFRAVDDFGDRTCYCDLCKTSGCTHDGQNQGPEDDEADLLPGATTATEADVLEMATERRTYCQYTYDDRSAIQASTFTSGFAQRAVMRAMDRRAAETGEVPVLWAVNDCSVCGCSRAIDESGDRVCFCDTCSEGCRPEAGVVTEVDDYVYGHYDRNWAATAVRNEEGRAVYGYGLETASASDPPCEICLADSMVEPIFAVVRNRAEQWQNKQVCDHRFCAECLVSWIGACIEDSNPHVRCPACKCRMLPDDVARISPGHVAQLNELLNRDFTARAQEIANDPELAKAFREFAQQCPSCSLWVGRSEGCDSMVCLCGTHFCYQCGSDACYGGCGERDRDYGNALYGEYLRPVCVDCNREMRPEWLPPGERGPEVHRCFDCQYTIETGALNDEGCLVCGCTSELDAASERVCFCDPCLEAGCVFVSPQQGTHEHAAPNPVEGPAQHPWSIEYAEAAGGRADEEHVVGCLNCGCSAEKDLATGERICFCDECHASGCRYPEQHEQPSEHEQQSGHDADGSVHCTGEHAGCAACGSGASSGSNSAELCASLDFETTSLEDE